MVRSAEYGRVPAADAAVAVMTSAATEMRERRFTRDRLGAIRKAAHTPMGVRHVRECAYACAVLTVRSHAYDVDEPAPSFALERLGSYVEAVGVG